MTYVKFEEMDAIMADVRDGDMSTLIMASLLAKQYQVPFFYRRVPKDHGTMDEIEGGLDKLKKCKNVFVLSRFEYQKNDD